MRWGLLFAALVFLMLPLAAMASNHSERETTCSEDIFGARQASYYGQNCTSKTVKLVCSKGTSVFQSEDDCEISYLKEKGWHAPGELNESESEEKEKNQSEKKMSEPSEPTCEGDVQDAKRSADGKMCTEQTIRLECPYDDRNYQAANGCEITYLHGQGWRPFEPESGCEEQLSNAKSASQGEACTFQVMTLECGGESYRVNNGCQISYLKDKGWTESNGESVEEDDSCSGCEIRGECIPSGARLGSDGQVYCGPSGEVQDQKLVGSACSEDYECSTNLCNGECVQERKGFFSSIASFFSALF